MTETEQLTAERASAERAAQSATKPSASQASSTATVTVGCKLPHGLILDLAEPGQPERRVVIAGKNRARIIGGYGLTPGVPKDFWDEWLAKHQALSFVKQGLVFAHKTEASAVAEAKEKSELRTGFEEIDRNALPSKIETAEFANKA